MPLAAQVLMILGVTFFTNGVSPASAALPLNTDLGGIPSQYTAPIQDLIAKWPPPALKDWTTPESLISVTRIQTPGDDTFIGVLQTMKIKAPIERVVAVVENYSEYSQLFNDLIHLRQENLQGNRWTVSAEQRIAVPFIANEKSEMAWIALTSPLGSRIYRFQLLKSRHQKSNDAFVVLEPISPTETLYIEADFWNANYGIARKFGTERIWKDSITGLVQSDLAIKLRAENPAWTAAKVKKASNELTRKLSFKETIKNPKSWSEAFGTASAK